MSPSPPQGRQPASASEKTGAILHMCNLPFLAAWAAVQKATGLRQSNESFPADMRNRMARNLACNLNVRQMRFVMGDKSAAQLMSSKSKKKKYPGYGTNYTVNGGNENFVATWITQAPDRLPSDPVLIYFHGGGYCLPIGTPQINFLLDIYKRVNNPRLSILALDYPLAPESKYPEQLCQAAQLYQQLVDVEGCTNVMLIGDSAGGNLVIQLLAHLRHQHPDAPRARSPVKPCAAIIMSPWVNLAPNFEGSYAVHDFFDIIDFRSLNYWAGSFCESRQERQQVPWISPMYTTSDFWDDVFPSEHTLVIWGGHEVMFDDFAMWAKIADIKDVVIEDDAPHIKSIFDRVPITMSRIVDTIALAAKQKSN